MSKRHSYVYSAAVNDVEEINASFSRGKMRIAYHGKNRKNTFISKKTFNESIHTIYNRPIVCHYMLPSDSIGGHDIEIVGGADGPRMINVTEPVGIVPESANTWWETVIEENGEEHEYLCCDILIWKRQQAYQHLLDNRVTDESMEIEIYKHHYDDEGVFHIDKFEFTAFCLLESVVPCFESAGITLFSLDECKAHFSQMLEDFKQEFNKVIPASADDTYTQIFSKGGKIEMTIEELMLKFGLSAEDITFDPAGMDQQELESRCQEIYDAKILANQMSENVPADPTIDEPDNNPTPEDPTPAEPQTFSLTNEQFMQELHSALSAVRIEDPYFGGTMRRYWYVDMDASLSEIYVDDALDSRLYGIPFSMNGDNVVIDFEAAKRKKVVFVDFDEGAPDNMVFGIVSDLCKDCKEKFDAMNNTWTETCNELQQFKDETLKQQRTEDEARIFSLFPDLAGNEQFEKLRGDCANLSIDELEDKCYAIRGRNSTQKFSMPNEPQNPIRLPVDFESKNDDEPYGGIFAEYGIGK